MEKQPNAHRIHAFLARPLVRTLSGLVALALAYVFVSWAIDSGSLLDYAIAILLFIYGVRDLWDVVRSRRKANG